MQRYTMQKKRKIRSALFTPVMPEGYAPTFTDLGNKIKIKPVGGIKSTPISLGDRSVVDEFEILKNGGGYSSSL